MGFMEQNVHLSRGLTALFVLGDKVESVITMTTVTGNSLLVIYLYVDDLRKDLRILFRTWYLSQQRQDRH